MNNGKMQVEELIRQGLFDDVEKKILALKNIDRKDAAAWANVARRINRNDLALKILNPIVRNQDQRFAVATAVEKLEYADALRQFGATEEAWNLLTEINGDDHPQTLLHQAFCLFSQWRYTEAIPLLQKYISNSSLSDYAQCLGQVNLAAALIQQPQLNDALTLVDSLLEKTKTLNFTLLYANSLELSAQILIVQKEYDLALTVLDQAYPLIKSAGRSTLFVEKWQAIATSLKKNEIDSSLINVSEKARVMKHWETVRECDLYKALLKGDNHGLHSIYFGTPYPEYRKKINQMSKQQQEYPDAFLWSMSDEIPNIIFDSLSGKVSGSNALPLPVGQVLHRFFLLMTQDFYKPRMTLSLFCHLFPGEVINANTSVNRVHQVIKRARIWLNHSDIPLEIEENLGSYRLVLKNNFAIRVFAKPPPLEDKLIEWQLLISNLSVGSFNIHQVMNLLETSESSARRLLNWALDNKKLRRSGQGSKTMYTLILN